METFTIFSIVASLILYTCWAFINGKPGKKLPPGPPKLPVIGNIHQVYQQAPHRRLAKLAEKYGPIMHLQLGQVSTVIISSPPLACEILKIHDINFSNRTLTPTSEIFFYRGGNIGSAPYGDYWRQLKKFYTLELLTAKKVKSFFYIRDDEVTRVFKFLEASSGAPVDFREMAREILNNIVSRATVGDICKDREKLLESVYYMLQTFNSFNMTNYYPRLNFLNVISGKKAEWLKMHKELDGILGRILEEHRSKPCREQDREDIVDIMLRVKETGTYFDQPLTDDHIKATVLEMMTAGTSSSSTLIEWAFYELMKHPEVMKKVQSELRSVVKGNRVAEEELPNLHYMKLVLKETMRLHGVPLLLPRENTKDCVVRGYDIPAGSKILVNAWACATDPNFWENPLSFIPERFENSSVGFSGTDFEFLPFGGGRRMCPGSSFGLSTLEYVISNLLHHYDWKLPQGLTPHDLDMRETIAISSLPMHPLHIVPIPVSLPN